MSKNSKEHGELVEDVIKDIKLRTPSKTDDPKHLEKQIKKVKEKKQREEEKQKQKKAQLVNIIKKRMTNK